MWKWSKDFTMNLDMKKWLGQYSEEEGNTGLNIGLERYYKGEKVVQYGMVMKKDSKKLKNPFMVKVGNMLSWPQSRNSLYLRELFASGNHVLWDKN
jgi:hypothetical protein